MIYCELCFDIEQIESIKDNDKLFGVIRTNGIESLKSLWTLAQNFLKSKDTKSQSVHSNLKQRNVCSKKGPENRNNKEAAMR